MLNLIFSTLVSNRTVGKIHWVNLVSFIFLISNYSIALATDKEKVYKIRLNTNPSVGSVDTWNLNGREASEEWVVIKVTGNKQFKKTSTAIAAWSGPKSTRDSQVINNPSLNQLVL